MDMGKLIESVQRKTSDCSLVANESRPTVGKDLVKLSSLININN